MMCKCYKCEHLLDDEPIRVDDVKSSNPFLQDMYHFEVGYRCTWNGVCSLDITDLPKGSCNKEID